MSRVDDALALIDRKQIAALTEEMVNIPSPVGDEQALAEFLGGRFKDAGLAVELQEVESGRCNLLATLKGTGGGASLLFGGHLDTPYRGDEEGIRELGPGFQPQARVDGDWIYGLGVSNMKGGIASAVVAVESLAKSKTRLRGDVTFAGIIGETCHVPVAGYQASRYRGTGIGAHAMIKRGVRPDIAIFPIQTSNTISVASGGFVYIELTTRGEPGSPYRRGSASLQPAPRTDAVGKMLKVIPALTSWGEAYMAQRRYRGQASAYAAVIAMEGGHPFRPTKLSSFCRLYFEIGLMPGDEPGAAIDGVRACVDDIERANPGLKVEMKVITITQGAEVPTEEPVVEALSSAFEASWGRKAELTWDGWCTDAGVFTRAGIPAISYGAQGRPREGANFLIDGEHVNVNDLARTAEVFVRAACDIGMRDRSEVRAAAASMSMA